MKRYHKKRTLRHGHSAERLNSRVVRQEEGGGFKCSHCKQWVVINEYMGTANRNHCNMCLWSKHVDVKKGDRRATCQGGMKPIGLTFRIEGSGQFGEVMLIHDCMGCEKVSINRLAADDYDHLVLGIFENSLQMTAEKRTELGEIGLYVAGLDDKSEVLRSLLGDGQNLL
jgi:hypothetical protein